MFQQLLQLYQLRRTYCNFATNTWFHKFEIGLISLVCSPVRKKKESVLAPVELCGILLIVSAISSRCDFTPFILLHASLGTLWNMKLKFSFVIHSASLDISNISWLFMLMCLFLWGHRMRKRTSIHWKTKQTNKQTKSIRNMGFLIYPLH